VSTLSVPIPASPTRPETLEDLLDRLGNVPLNRIRMNPPPGLATERDVVEIEARENRLCELVDATLVEKTVGLPESFLAIYLARLLGAFVDERNLGLVTGPDGTLRLFPGMVRIPDVAFISWGRVPGGRVPKEPIPDVVPDLAVEVLSAGNTPAEMSRKRKEYFEAGVRLVWLVDAQSRTVTVYTAPTSAIILDQDKVIDGGDVLPGFTLAVHQLFAQLDRQANA